MELENSHHCNSNTLYPSLDLFKLWPKYRFDWNLEVSTIALNILHEVYSDS
jgi:hypothetical protein